MKRLTRGGLVEQHELEQTKGTARSREEDGGEAAQEDEETGERTYRRRCVARGRERDPSGKR